MKSLIAAAAIVAFSASTAAAAGCNWGKTDAVADLDVKTDKQHTAMQSTPVDASQSQDRTAEGDRVRERPQLAVDPRADDAASN